VRAIQHHAHVKQRVAAVEAHARRLAGANELAHDRGALLIAHRQHRFERRLPGWAALAHVGAALHKEPHELAVPSLARQLHGGPAVAVGMRQLRAVIEQ
jgi:hypothetical protein